MEAGFTPYWHFHPEMELTFISKGNGVRYVGDSILPFDKNELVLVGENLPHQWISSVHSIAHVIQFQKNDLLEIKELRHLDPLFKRSKRGLLFDRHESVETIIQSFDQRSKIGQLAALINLFDLLTNAPYKELSSQNHLMAHGENYDKIQYICQSVLKDPCRKISIGEMADKAHMTKESFCRWFKRETGNTFINYLNTTKVEIASRLLIERTDSISSIAFEVGFKSISQFNRVFKQKKGCSPREFRKSIYKESQN
ncbi:MAG: AraC family transcriptional regulator [Bacteroidota bacterium]